MIRRLPPTAIVALAITVTLVTAVGATAWIDRRGPSVASDEPVMLAREGVLDLSSVPAAVATEFHFARAHLDAYRELTCWCGCETAFGHRSLADCFVRPDGRWEAHGAGCGVCLAEAQVARNRIGAGVSIETIAAELDRDYGSYPTIAKDER